MNWHSGTVLKAQGIPFLDVRIVASMYYTYSLTVQKKLKSLCGCSPLLVSPPAFSPAQCSVPMRPKL